MMRQHNMSEQAELVLQATVAPTITGRAKRHVNEPQDILQSIPSPDQCAR